MNGDKYYKIGKFREASILYRTAIKKDPRFGEAHLHLARAMLKMGHLGDAVPALRSAIELLPEGPGRVEARVTVSDICLTYLQTHSFDKAMAGETGRLADELISRDPKSFHGFRIRGTLATLDAARLAQTLPSQARTRLDDAINDLRAADAIRPFDPSILVPLGRSLWAAGQEREAEKFLLSATEHRETLAAPSSEDNNRERVSAYSELCRMYSKTGRIDEAEKILKLAIKDNEHTPKQFLFLADLAGLYQHLGQRADLANVLRSLKTHAVDYPEAYEVAGSMYLRSEDFRQAIREYEEGMSAFPKNKAHYQRLIVEALMAANQRSEAEAVNEAILRESPRDINALARRAGFLFDKGDVDKSIAQLEALLRQTPNHYLIHYNLGRALMAKGRREDARFQFSESIRWGPQFVPARIALAQVQLSTGEFGAAVLSADGALALDEKSSRAMLLRVVGLRAMGKNQEARQALDALLKLYPSYDEALLQLGALDAQESKFKAAEAAFRQSYENGNLGGLMAIVKTHLARNESGAAVKILQTETKKHPDRMDLRVALADTEMEAGHRDAALSEFQFLLKKLEKNPRAQGELHLRLGEYYKRVGELQTAIAHLQQARQLLPDNPKVLHNLGVLHDMLGEKEEAKGFYEASLRIDGEDGVALNNLAYYMAENGGDLDRALTFAQRARQKMPHQLEFGDTIAYIYLKKNLTENALEILADLVNRKPDQMVFRLHLAQALLKKGDRVSAGKELRLALASKPSAEDSVKIQDLLTKSGT